MLFRFSLYGFLKNQRYYEPFLYLALLDYGLSFFVIGLLVAFREIVVNVLEIPSGAIADVFGRRKSMILSFTAYIGSFLIFGLARETWMFFAAMFFLAIGEAFRTGTHKAMIFSWLRQQGRESERTRVYGYTRSWSKIGSALSVVIAAIFVFVSQNYAAIFFYSAAPCVLNIINFLGYPRSLDADGKTHASAGQVLRHMITALRGALARPALRRLVAESMGFEGVFHAIKDYLQPVIQIAAVAFMARYVRTSEWSEIQQSSVLIGVVYVVLYALSAIASRKAHRLAEKTGSEDAAARMIWIVNLITFIVLTVAAYFEIVPLLILAFVGLFVMQNLWRPILISRFDIHGNAEQGATILSIESQSRRVATMLFAPAVGLAVDAVTRHDLGGPFWPIGALGIVIAAGFFLTARSGPKLQRSAGEVDA